VVIPKVLSSPVQIHSSHLYSSFALKWCCGHRIIPMSFKLSQCHQN
jgi:hypothetical protein